MNKKRASNIEVKKINRLRTFRYVCKRDRVSKTEIAAALGISVPTVLQNVNELMERGLLREVGEFASTGGRKASAISLEKESRLALGVDITGNHIGMVLSNLAGDILIHKREYEPLRDNPSYYRNLADRINTFVKENVRGDVNFLGYGFSLPGIIDREGENIISSHVLGVDHISCSVFSRYLDGPCVFINDANAAGFAEYYHNPRMNNAAYLSLSQSVGGVFIQNRESLFSEDPIGDILYRGDNNRSSEFGHMTLYPGGDLCYCGKEGCVDRYCSARVLTGEEGIRLEDFFQRLAARDGGTEKIWDRYLSDLAVVVNNLRMIYDCKVVVGGYVGGFMEPWMDRLRKKVERRNTFENDADYVEACTFKTESSALGAALIQIEEFIHSI